PSACLIQAMQLSARAAVLLPQTATMMAASISLRCFIGSPPFPSHPMQLSRAACAAVWPRASLAARTARANSRLLGGKCLLFVRALTIEGSLRDRAHARAFAIESSDLRLELSRRFCATLFGSDRRAFPSRHDRGDLTGGLLALHLHSAAAVTNDLPDA